MNTQKLTEVFSHRGSSGNRPENTMLSFQEAVRVGADGIEFDVQLSKDGVPVVIHDEKLDRTTNGQGWVKDHTYQALRQLDAGSWFADTYKQAQIPALEEVLAWAQTNSVALNIELKTGKILYPQMEEKVMDLVAKYGLDHRVILSSFNHYSLAKVRQLHKTIETAILFMEGLYQPWNYAKTLGANGLHCYWPIAMVEEILQGARQAGMPIRPFTVNDETIMERCIRNGCKGIITDWPEKAIRVRGNAI